MVPRNLEPQLRRAAERMPVVAITGPRQSGKTTLARAVFPHHEYVSLEPLDVRDFAAADPRGFLGRYRAGAVFDEVQRAPALFSYLQEEVDRNPSPGRFILTGSQHFGLTEAITQSLAGRIALLHLLPLSLDEAHRFDTPPEGIWPTVWTGGYPRIHDRRLDAGPWLADYVATYVQRDVRQVLAIGDLDAFTTFVRLAAARTGQEVNLSAWGGDAGVSHNTARAWLSVLETSFIVLRIPRWHRNLRKRAVKAPKLHFVDTGLACHLLGIRTPEQLEMHPLRGAVFESWCAAEVLKARMHDGRPADLFHLREDRGLEVDLVAEAGERVYAVEVKSGATLAQEFFGPLMSFNERVTRDLRHLQPIARLVYGGDRRETRHGIEVLPWAHVQDVSW
jgi:uncharacterized protein